MKYLKFSDVFPTTKGKSLTRTQMVKLAHKVSKALIKEKEREVKNKILENLL